jgi:multicomponent Na+:H+ antiporter subunit C
MESFIIMIAGVLFTIGTYLILTKNLLRIILGITLFSHGAHLMLMAINGLKKGAAPILGEGATTFTDPVPQALILTSIVISFALTAYMLVLGYRTFVEYGIEDLKPLKGNDHE